jgi:hypothetical protein
MIRPFSSHFAGAKSAGRTANEGRKDLLRPLAIELINGNKPNKHFTRIEKLLVNTYQREILDKAGTILLNKGCRAIKKSSSIFMKRI